MPDGKLRLAHLVSDLDTGGAEHMLMRLARGLAPEHGQLVVSMTDGGALRAEIEAAGIPVVSLGMRRGRPSATGYVRAVIALRRFAPSVLQTWLYHADLLGTLLLPCVGRPALAWNLRCADMQLDEYGWLTGRVRGLLARLSHLPQAIVANSHAAIAAHQAFGYRARRWIMIGNGFDVDRFVPDAAAPAALRSRLGIAPGTRIVGMLARRDPAKDHATLLAAAATVVARRADVVFYLAGTGVDTLAHEIAVRGLRGKVLVEDVRGDVAAICAGLDLLVLSSAFGESFPNVLGEAMACGTPCVSTDVGDSRQLLAGSGIVVPRRAPEALAAALLEALAWSPAERTERGRLARARIIADYGLERIVARYTDLYRELAA